MKLSNKIFTLGLLSLASFSLVTSLVVNRAPKQAVEVSATEGYTTYHNEELGFVTRDSGDTRVVKGDVDGGMQTKGNVLDEKSEIRVLFKKTVENYWIGVGGYAVYFSNSTTTRALYLGYNSSGAYSRNAEKSGLVMKTADGSVEMTSAFSDGKLFSDYATLVMKFDLSNLSAVKLSFYAEYQNVKYYPFESSTKLETITYTHQASGFAEADKYRAMAGANATDSGVSLLKFNTQQKDLSSIISRGSRSFNYAYIGDFEFKLTLSEQISSFSGYLNNHLNEWTYEDDDSINIADALLINGKTFRYWVNYNNPDLIVNGSGSAGVHAFPTYAGYEYTPVALNVANNALIFTFNTAFIPSDSIIITFKAGLFKGYYNGISYGLSNDLTFYGTLKDSDYGAVGSNITFLNSVTESVGEYTIETAADWGEKTAANGAKYRRFALYTNVPRDKTNITEVYPYDHYRYMFDNIMFNGKSLTYYNVWGRANGKDYIDLGNGIANNDYELEHPTSGINYNMVTFAAIATNQDNYVFFIEIPNKLMEDFSYSTYSFALRDGSAWKSPSGVVRINMSPSDRYAVTNFVDDYMHFNDVSTDNHNDTGACKTDSGYYLTAKKALNALSADQKAIFQNGTEAFADAKERYEAWAFANHDAAPYDGNNSIVSFGKIGLPNVLNENGAITIVIIVTLTSLVTLCMFLLFKKRKNIK